MTSENTDPANDKMRLCHTCRMPISVLATKCRFCGADVGRPKEEARHLTIRDLGGENKEQRYNVSPNVLDALESFRVDELTNSQIEPPKQKTLFGIKFASDPGEDEPEEKHEDRFTAIAELEQSISQLSPHASAAARRSAAAKKKRSSNDFVQKIMIVVAVLIGAVVLYFGGNFAMSKYREYQARKNFKPDVYVENRAMDILGRGSVLEALQEAVAVAKESDTPENQKVLDRIRQKIGENIEQLLNGDPWSPDALKDASKLIYAAVEIDRYGTMLTAIRKEVDEESFAYKMAVENTDVPNKQATVKLIFADKPTQSIVRSEGDVVRGRFVLKKVGPTWIQLSDTMRKTRLNQDREFKVFQDGTIG